MATSSPSPASPLATPPTSTVTPPPSPSTPTPDSPTETNANPPESSTVSPPAPLLASPPPASPTPSEPPPTSPTPVATSPPLVSATSPPPPTADPPSPSVDAPPPSSPPPPSSTTPTPTTTLPTSPPPPASTTTIVPPVTSPPSDPQTSPPPPTAETNSPPPPSTETNSPPPPTTMETNSPPPPTSKTKSPSPSKSSPPQSSPPPPPLPVSESQPPEIQPPPPSVSGSTYPPPPSTRNTPEPPSSPQSPKSSPSSPSASPSKDSPSTPTSQISPTVSHLSPPPVSSTTLGSLVPSSSANQASDNSTASSPSKGGVPMGGIVAIGLVVGFILLGLILLVVCCIYKRKRKDFKHNGRYIVPSPYGSSPRSDSNLIVKTAVSSSIASGSGALSPHSHGGLHSRSWFTYQELYEATNGFALEHLLGEGGFGSVYKGVLANGKEIAVKQLKIGGSQGEREFQAEVEIISRIHHRHLVSLVGYCMFESKRLLVYEYVPNQTLYYHLHGENRPVMDWFTRIKIAVGAARGIAYLHEDCHPRIIHRDIKSSNILLDNKFEARVADFGLAKLALDVDTHVSTRVMGTFGYMAPEYATSGKLTDKSDVYSFGVVLLELLTGRKPVDSSQPLGDESLVEWARPLLSHALETGQVEGLVDPRLEKNYVESELFLMTEAAAACVRHSATKRPRMAQVVRAFDGLSPSDLSNGMRVGQSEIYDSAQQSAEIRWFRRMAFGSQDYSTDYFSEVARNNTGILNPNQNNQGPIFSTQHSRNDLTQQQSQNIYFSSQRTQGSAFSNQLSQDSTLLRQSSQNLAFQQQSSQNLTFLGAA